MCGGGRGAEQDDLAKDGFLAPNRVVHLVILHPFVSLGNSGTVREGQGFDSPWRVDWGGAECTSVILNILVELRFLVVCMLGAGSHCECWGF